MVLGDAVSKLESLKNYCVQLQTNLHPNLFGCLENYHFMILYFLPFNSTFSNYKIYTFNTKRYSNSYVKLLAIPWFFTSCDLLE